LIGKIADIDGLRARRRREKALVGGPYLLDKKRENGGMATKDDR